VTEPLPQDVHDQIGWRGAELLGNLAHAYVYAQRTADGRIAFGGRGKAVPLRVRAGCARPHPAGDDRRAHPAAARVLPPTRRVAVEHAWCGVLAVPRDWSTTVHVDPRTGLGWAGGYVGSGLTTTNLAGRTLRDLVLGDDTELTRLPWTGRQVRQWEPEPLALARRARALRLYREADRREARGLPRTSLLARVADRVSGRG
jgi:glycine/D-amino acid oxidase-like deaminating enzyme